MERLTIITGLSGSGKSLAARCFEDLGFFCVDNLPVALIPPFYDLIERGAEQIPRAALVIDVREKAFLGQFPGILRELRERQLPIRVVFFECSDAVLKRRFSETRRPHPVTGPTGTLEESIRLEREALTTIKNLADRVIDTSHFTAHELRSFLQNAYGEPGSETQLNVNVVSFGFKYGLPAEADLVFDVRFLPNPYFVEELRALDGTTPEVRRFLDAQQETEAFRQRLRSFLEFLLPLYAAEGKSYLSVALGCTGGKHRSVALAQDLGRHLRGQGVRASVHHRDLGKE